MRYIFLLFFASYSIASSLLTYNIYERSDRVDIMLSFDAPYEGQIFQKKGNNIISLSLSDLFYDKLVEKNINSKIVQELTIDPTQNSTIVTLKSNKAIGVFASKTIDGFGLRVRIKLLAPPVSAAKTPLPEVAQASSAFDVVDSRYFLLIGVMILLLIVLYWAKWKIKKHKLGFKPKKKSKSWLFKTEIDDIEILSQKIIDGNNRIVLFGYKNQQYLVLTGNSNILLDRYNGNKPVSIKDDDEFGMLFEQNRQKLDNYLKLQQSSQLSNYKEKVSQDYTVKE